MIAVGLLDRMMRSSVDRAMRMQPRRTSKVVDEFLYSAPSARDEVAAVHAAAARLVTAGLSPLTLGSVAVRRSATKATITALDADLSAIDNRHLETVDIDDGASPALAAIRAGAAAAVWAFPPHLMAAVAQGVAMPETGRLASAAGPIAVAGSLGEARSGLTVVTGEGAVAGHDDPLAAVTRLEAAEAMARIAIIEHTIRRTNG
jgi:ribulose-5-phosphate 4-epimerase/fuculose-1-phosphate aldolase